MGYRVGTKVYKNPLWQVVRDGVMLRDGYVCQKCGDIATEVHHKVHLTPDNVDDFNIAFGEDNLISLCHACHMEQHSLDKNGHDNVLPDYYFDADGNIVTR